MQRPRPFLLPLLLLVACQASAPPITVLDGRVSSFDGVEIAYEARGRGEPTLVFVHGWCCSREQWAGTMEDLGVDHHVVALDLVGHGHSGKRRESWSMAAFARDIEAVADELGIESMVLVGHSMGGPVCLEAAVRLEDRVVGVIGVDTLHDAAMVYTEEMSADFIEALETDFVGSVGGFIQSTLSKGTDPAVKARIEADVKAAGQEVAVEIVRGYVDYSPARTFQACSVPLICINAVEPHPTEVENNRQYIPDFEAVLVEDVGHWIMLERPEEFAELLRAAIVRVQELARARD